MVREPEMKPSKVKKEDLLKTMMAPDQLEEAVVEPTMPTEQANSESDDEVKIKPTTPPKLNKIKVQKDVVPNRVAEMIRDN